MRTKNFATRIQTDQVVVVPRDTLTDSLAGIVLQMRRCRSSERRHRLAEIRIDLEHLIIGQELISINTSSSNEKEGF